METIDPVRRRLAVEVPANEVSAQIERAYDDLKRTAYVRGFRPGRAPRSVLEQLFSDRVRADVFGRLVQESYVEALRGQNIEPVGQPEIVTESAQPGEPLRYSATVEVRPEVVAAGYGGLEIEKPLRTVTEADLDRFLEELRQSFAQLRPIADRTRAAAGDLATIDYEARVAGRVVGRGEKRLVPVAEGDEEFGKRLEGAEVGSTIEFEIDYPAEHGNKDLAGKRVSFRVMVRSLSTKDVPTLDDEFAKDHGEVDTLEQLRERARQRLEAEAAHDAERAARNAAVAELVRRHEIEVPQAMASRRAETLAEQFLDSLGSRRPPASREADMLRQLAADLMPRAVEQVKAELILAAIASQENLQVDDTIVDEQVDRLAARAGAAGERVRALYQDASARASLRASLLEERALDLVMERAQVRPVEISGIAEAERNG